MLDFIKAKMAGLLSPDVQETIIGSAEILEIFKVSKVGKVAGSKVVDGEITQNSSARVIRDGAIIFNGKIGSIFREKDQTKQVSAGLECGITLKDFGDYQKKDIIEVYNSTITEISVIDVSSEIIARATSDGPAFTSILPFSISLSALVNEYTAPISIADSIIGYVRLKLDSGYIERSMIDNLALIIIATLLLLLVASAITSLY